MTDAPAPVGPPYHQIHRMGLPGWWRPLVGAISMVALMFVLLPAIVSVAFVVGFFVSGADVSSQVEQMIDLDDPTPLTLAYLNVTLGGLIPAVFLVNRVVHGLKPRWLTSVFPRMRWKYFAACLLLAVLALFATVLVSFVVPTQPGDEMVGDLNPFNGTMVAYLLVMVFLTPLQAAGEEYLFRGYLIQAFGGLFTPFWRPYVAATVAILGSSLLFALAHGIGQPLPVFFDRFAFGVVAGILVVRTGGLEAGIAMHVLNNFLAFSFAILVGDMGDTLNPSESTWWSIPVTLTQSVVYLALALWVARVMGLSRNANPAVLVASRSRV